MNKIVAKIAGAIGIRWLTGKASDAANGRLGPRWHALYWKAVGLKRVWSLLLMLLAVSLGYAQEVKAAMILGTVASIGLALGFLDAQWRTPSPAWIYATPWWRWLSDNSALLASAMGATVAAASTCNPDTAALLAVVHLSCANVVWITGLLGVLAGAIGLSDIALRAQPPRPPTPIAFPVPEKP